MYVIGPKAPTKYKSGIAKRGHVLINLYRRLAGFLATVSLCREEDFSTAFPYHILLDRALCVRQCGINIRKLLVDEIQENTPLRMVVDIVQPLIMEQTIENIVTYINSVFILALHRKIGEKPFFLKGMYN